MKYNVYSHRDMDKNVCLMVAKIIKDMTNYNPKVIQHGESYVVRVGTYPTKEKAEEVIAKLKKKQVEAILYLSNGKSGEDVDE